jgi:8-oxo-dGTP pyrophosphatase MutT (NUDIX family)
MTMDESKKQSAVCLVRNGDGRVLCVWNRRYGFWTLPGGKVEAGETPEAAAARELLEETNLKAMSLDLIYAGPTAIGPVLADDASRVVHLYRTYVSNIFGACAMEQGCPLGWFAPEEVMQWSGFREYYYRALGWSYTPDAPSTSEEVEKLRRENANLTATLTIVQERCTALALERRADRVVAEEMLAGVKEILGRV